MGRYYILRTLQRHRQLRTHPLFCSVHLAYIHVNKRIVTCNDSFSMGWKQKGHTRGCGEMYLHSAELNAVAVTEMVNTFILV